MDVMHSLCCGILPNDKLIDRTSEHYVLSPLGISVSWVTSPAVSAINITATPYKSPRKSDLRRNAGPPADVLGPDWTIAIGSRKSFTSEWCAPTGAMLYDLGEGA